MTTTTAAPAEVRHDVRQAGTLLIVVGAISAIAGVLAIVYPDVTLLALALIAGINLLLLGALGLVDAFGGDGDSTTRVLAAVLGLLGIVAGLVVIKRPGETLLVLVLAVGVWLVVAGVVDLVRALVVAGNRGIRALAGVVDIVLGGLILALPKLSLGTLAVLIGLAFVVRGGVCIVRGVQVRKAVAA